MAVVYLQLSHEVLCAKIIIALFPHLFGGLFLSILVFVVLYFLKTFGASFKAELARSNTFHLHLDFSD